MFHLAPHNALITSTSSLSPTSPVSLPSSSLNPDLFSTYPLIHCEDPRQDGTSTEFHSSTPNDDLSKPRKVHCHRKWKNTQDAVYRINQFSPSTIQRTTVLGKPGPMPLLYTALCQQVASTEWFLNKGNELYLKDSWRLVPHRRLYIRVLGNRSSRDSSSKTPLRVRLPAPGNWIGVLRHLLRKKSLHF